MGCCEALAKEEPDKEVFRAELVGLLVFDGTARVGGRVAAGIRFAFAAAAAEI